MKFYINHTPTSKKRYGFHKYNGKTYDPQNERKRATQWDVASQMHEKGLCLLSKQPLRMSLTAHTAMPQSWPSYKKKAFLGSPVIKTPDADNLAKFYCDVLNRVAYEDDAHISQLWVEKIYALQDGVEINLTPLGGEMIQEHATTVKGELLMADLEYLVKKAHRIGLTGRQLVRVYSQEDEEGKHIYFECSALKNHSISNRGHY